VQSLRLTVRVLCVLVLCSCASTFAQTAGLAGEDPARFDDQVEAATVRHDANFFTAALADDVRFSHGTGLVQNKEQWVESVRKSTSSTERHLDSVLVEPHGEIVETTGHVQVKLSGANAREYHIWFVRVYAKRAGAWQLVSNRTVREVDGPLTAPTAEYVPGKPFVPRANAPVVKP
jgi:Domain of unknown function (DUF4440)